MSKIVKNRTLPATTVQNPTDSARKVEVNALDLRGIRRGTLGTSTLLDESTERLWRNCKYPETVTFQMYYDMYSRNNVAARVIETFPEYTWNVMPIVTDEGGPKSRFSKEVTKLFKKEFTWQDGLKQSLFITMKQLDVLGGIGGEALLVFGFKDNLPLETPVRYRQNTEIAWIKLLHNGQFVSAKIDNDQNSETYGDVELYETKDFLTSRDLNFKNYIRPGVKIHASRCVHFKESAGLPYGTSRIQKCYNQLLDIAKLSGASAEVYWLGAFSGLAVETDADARLDAESYDAMKEEVQKYFDGLARSLMFEGAKAKLLYPAIVSPKEHFDLQITMISIATAIPRRFLTGAEAAKLASQQDSINWMDRVMNRRDVFIGPKVVSPVVQRCVAAGVLPKPKGEGGQINVAWPKTQSLALNERANAARNMTEAIVAYLSNNMHTVMPLGVYLTGVCGFSDDEAEEIVSLCPNIQKWKAPKVQTSNAFGNKTSPSGTDDDGDADDGDGGDSEE